MKVFIPQDITDAGKDFLREKGYEVVVGSGPDVEKILSEGGADADGILIRTGELRKDLLAKLPKLKVIGRHGIGTDNIDVDVCTEMGITVTYAPTSNANSVAEHSLCMILACARHLVYLDHETRKLNWELRNKVKGIDLSGKTLGIVGLGRIGQMLAKKAAMGMDMKVIGYDAFLPADKWPEYVTKVDNMGEIFRTADFVSLHTPATPETRKMVNRELLATMKPTAFLINCARGEVVDEAALYEALKNNVIAGAATDVFDPEPPKADNPLFELDNLIVSPHNAALTQESMDRMGLHAAMGIHDVLSGNKPQWPVNTVK